MTRLFADGDPIEVGANVLGVPRWLEWEGKRHPVEHVTRRWRVDEEWWRERLWREYFRLATTTGLLVEVYHDLNHHRWVLQRIFD